MNAKERPPLGGRASRSIIFSTEMVNALLAARKTQTRRLVKGSDGCPWDYPLDAISPWMVEKCKYGKVGDRLWVREKIYCLDGNTLPKDGKDYLALWSYGCDYATNIEDSELDTVTKVVSPIYMPRWCCRIELVLNEVSIKRLADISEADAIAEGLIPKQIDGQTKYGLQGYRDEEYIGNPRIVYKRLWDSLNHAEGTRFLDSPWVWVLKFDVATDRN